MERAYSLIETKEFREDEDKIYIEGIASTPSPDRMGDVVEPMGARFKAPMPLLWQHDHQKPVGHMTFAKPNKNGIPFKGELPKIKEAGNLQDRVNEAIHSLKYKLVTAVSIGFSPVNDAYERMESGGFRFKEWEWLELSLVTIPANSEAVLGAVKSFDQQLMAASGRKSLDRSFLRSGVSGTQKRKPILLNK